LELSSGMQKQRIHHLLLLLALVFGLGATACPVADQKPGEVLQEPLLHLAHQETFEQVGLVEVPPQIPVHTLAQRAIARFSLGTALVLSTSSFAAPLALAQDKPDTAAAAAPSPLLTGANYAERSLACAHYFAAAAPRSPTFPKDGMPFLAARLQLGVDPAGTLAALDRMLDATLKAKPDPFNLHAVMHCYFVHKKKFTPAMAAKVKRLAASWSYSKPIGVSMNYELMRDVSGWLAAQEWPDLVDASRNNAATIQKNCADWLWRIWRETTDRNASEYDAPVYYGTDFGPTRMIAEFARDPAMSKAAAMSLDFMLIHTGAHWHHGYHISTAGRGKYWGSLNLSPHSASPTNSMAWLLYGSTRPFNINSAPQSYWLAHPGRVFAPDFLSGWQAALPDNRTVLANHIWPSHKQIVRKTAWFTTGYGLASQRDDGSPFDSSLFKECRRTMLKWDSPFPASTFTLIQENRRRPSEKIPNAFAYGENPYCQTLQHEGTLIGVHDVPTEYAFWATRAPFTTTGAIVKRAERDGWVLCHGGSMLFAFRFTEPAKWDKPNKRDKLDLLRCDAQRGGWILETSPLAPFAGGGVDAELTKFAAALLAKTKFTAATKSSPPSLNFTNLRGHVLSLRWKPAEAPVKNECLVDGKPVRYDLFPLLETHGVHQPNGGALTLQFGNQSRVYDFKKWTVTETEIPPAKSGAK